MINTKRVKPWMLVSAVWIGPGILSVISQVMQRRLNGDPPPTVRELLWAAGDWIVYALITPFIFWAAERWPIERPFIARRSALHLAFSTLMSICWALSGKLLDLVLSLLFAREKVTQALETNGVATMVFKEVANWIFITLPFGMVVYLSVLGIAHGIRFYRVARERDVANAKLAEQLAGARYAALQAQVNPHFLFNTLNTVAVLVRDNERDGAVRIVERLSDVLRRTLDQQRGNEVSLQDELELVQQYLAIEQERFSDRLRTSVDVSPSLLSAAVPGFAVQHLVENAIRHGVTRRQGAGNVDISARVERGVLVIAVADDGAGLAPDLQFPTGHGIANTRQRLESLYGEGASLEVTNKSDGGTIAIMRLPYHVYHDRQTQ